MKKKKMDKNCIQPGMRSAAVLFPIESETGERKEKGERKATLKPTSRPTYVPRLW